MRRLGLGLGLVLALGCTSSSDDDEAGATDDPSAGSSGVTSSGTGESTSGDPTTASSTSSDGSTSSNPTTDPSTTSTTGSSATSGSSGGEELIGCYDYDAFTPTTVGYRADVMPILAARCAGCHSDPQESVYYGMGGTTEAEATAIYDKLLNGVPKQAPDLSFIVPFDPVRSYMMAKVEYDDPGGTCSVIQCSEPGCELQAPPAGQLPETELAVLRSWVMGGALDD